MFISGRKRSHNRRQHFVFSTPCLYGKPNPQSLKRSWKTVSARPPWGAKDALAAWRTASWGALHHLSSFWPERCLGQMGWLSHQDVPCQRASLIHGRMWTFSPSVTQWGSQSFNEGAEKVNSTKYTFLSFQLCGSEVETRYRKKSKKPGYLGNALPQITRIKIKMLKLCCLAIVTASSSSKSFGGFG